MENYPTYFPQYQPQRRQDYFAPPRPEYMQQPSYRCCPVTSREEAAAVQSDFFGPGTLMPDMGHGIIYFKRFNQNTGASDFYEFALVQPKEPEQTADPMAVLQTFGERLESMADKIDVLYHRLNMAPKDGDDV